MDLTGNPFVDIGLMVLTSLAGKDRVSSLTFPDIRNIVGDASNLSGANQNLKCFTMVFGTNGPLTQPAYKKSDKGRGIYEGIVRQLLYHAENEGSQGSRCDLTGVLTDFDFQRTCAKALKEAGLPIPEKKWLGRDWVPLGGSLGNDAQALPGASRPMHASALALLALQYLPLGTFLFKGKLVCYQSTADTLCQRLVAERVNENQRRLELGETEILGKGRGTGIILDFLIELFESLRDVVREEALPVNTELLLWLFSNSGAGADCRTEAVPETALRFVYDAVSMDFASEIRKLIANDPKDPRQQIFECIRSQRDYPGLYPYKKWPGASIAFYEMYQRTIRNASESALAVARDLARRLTSNTDKKLLKDIRKPDFLSSTAGRNRVRGFIVEHLSIDEYGSLFPSSAHPIRVNQSGWQFLRYYLSRQEEDLHPRTAIIATMKTTHPKIEEIATEWVQDKDPKKIKTLLDRMAQRKVGIRWLQDRFCRMAEQHKDWNVGTWDEFVCDEDGKYVAFELLFQLRLHLSNVYREAILKQRGASI